MNTQTAIGLACVLVGCPVHADDLADILGSPTNDWHIAGKTVVSEVNGRSVLGSAPSGLTLTSLRRIAPDSELSVQLRFAPVERKALSFSAFLGLSNPDDTARTQSSLTLGAAANEELTSVVVSFPPPKGETYRPQDIYSLRVPAKISEKWPEIVRKKIEQDNATVPLPTNRWLNLRYVLRKDNVQVWLDDRLLREVTGADAISEGHFRLSFWQGLEMASVRVRGLPPDDPLFEPVPLDGYLTASKPAGNAVKPGQAKIGGVPFVVPETDDRRLNFIDLGRSWMRFGLLEGDFDGRVEPARWRGALSGEPGRIQFRVRNARYSKLHLLASYDGARDTIPLVSVQFYRPSSGFPVTFSTRVEKGRPHLVTVPLEPDVASKFSDADYLEFELTKEVRLYRSYPDPIEYSEHAGGLPSGVHVYAITLERPAVNADFQPDKFANIWTAPATPSYTVKLSNRTAQPRSVRLNLSTDSHDHLDKTSTKRFVNLAANAEETVQIPVTLKRYGYHDVKLRVEDKDGAHTLEKSLAFLHPDTRERGGWEEGKGPIFGFWDWNGGHGTVSGMARWEIMFPVGIESSFHSFQHEAYTDEDRAFAEKHGMLTHFIGRFIPHKTMLGGVDYDPNKPDEMKARFTEFLRNTPIAKPSAINKPELAMCWAEPQLGPVSYRSIPEYYGDPPYEMTEKEKENYEKFLGEFLFMARAIKQVYPNAKVLLPWGLPLFPVPFLRNSKEATELMDGPALDMVLFERIPEMQIHQITYASQLWQLKQEWLKHSPKPWPKFTSIEGPCVSPSAPAALTPDQEADHTVRAHLVQAAYGTTRHLGFPTASRCAGPWGESHYGNGLVERIPILTPKPVYVAYATMTRQLNRMNFVKTIDTGNTTVFCLQFKHYKTGELLHIFWTLRGTRPVTIETNNESRITSYDSMDNETALDANGSKITFTLSASPIYIRGLQNDAKVAGLGKPDHSDSKPASGSLKLANLGDGSWRISTETDEDYATSHIEFVKRFPGKMTVQPIAADKPQGGKALAVHLEKQEKERKVMPFYTTLVPAKPIAIPGKASHLGLWVRAAGDWGRVVYCLRDAKGERWLSVGKKGEWNCDDVHNWSAFNFDGWRYLRFELPGNTAWDCYREAGTSFWGYYGPGDGIVDLPFALEKIMVERRTHVIQVDELKPANPDDVFLGDLFAEYQKPFDKREETVRQSRLRMISSGEGSSSKQQTDAPQNPYH